MINRFIAKLLPFLPKPLVWTISRKYIAGVNINDALKVAREINQNGMMVTVDLLGENIANLSEAGKHKLEYIELIKRFTSEKIDGNFSVKPSMFGLQLDFETGYQNLREIVNTARLCNSFIRIDMEDSSCTSDEIRLFRRLKNEFPLSVGLVLQAYLKRTSNDIKELLDLHKKDSPLNIRLCKGIYIESEHISFKDPNIIREHFIEDLNTLFQNGVYVGIATHDNYLVRKAYELIDQYQIPVTNYEFQMLYGVTPNLGRSILAKGKRMRIYVPFGKEWFNYSIRRLNENPKIVGHIIKALFFRN